MRRILVAFCALCLALVAAPTAHSSSGTDIYGDVLRVDTTWTAAGSPYRVHEAVQVAEGAVLRLEPGVRVTGIDTDALFVLAGGLTVAGTPDAPVVLDGGGRAGAAIRLVSRNVDRILINVSHADISRANTFLASSGWATYVNLILTDSVLRGLPGYNYLWYPIRDNRIERNVFSDSGGFSVGLRNATVLFQHNRFMTASTTGYWVRSWAQYGEASLTVTGNAFLAPGTPSVALEQGYSTAGLSAVGNYWGTTDPAVIDRMVLDERDSIDRVGIIPVDPILTAIPAQVPPAPIQPPSPPRDVLLTPDDSQVQVTWTAPQDEGGSPVTSYTATANPGGSSCTAPVTGCTITSLSRGQTYQVVVTATNAAGTSAPSAAAEVTFATTPAAPTLIAGKSSVVRVIAASDGGSPLLRWEYRSRAGTKWTPWRTTPAGSGMVRVSPCPAGKTLTVEVRGVNAVGAGQIGATRLLCPRR